MFATIKALLGNIGTLISLLELIPTITGLVHQVEASGSTGAQKKSAVMTLITDAVNFATGTLKINLPTDTITSFASTIIDTIVAVENMLGTLTHSSATASAAAEAAPAMAAQQASTAPAIATEAAAASSEPAAAVVTSVTSGAPVNELLANEFGG